MFKKFVQQKNVCHLRRQCYRLMLVAFALMTVSQTVGCGVWKQARVGESIMITYRDHVWAKRAYNLRYSNCDRPYPEHFENGFRAGYTSVSQGGDGFVPALPPAEYRSYEFQSADGARCVSSWFEGFPAGVAAARKDKTGNYNDVMISRLINSAVSQEAVKPVLPQDVPVVASRQTASGRRSVQLPAIRPEFTPAPNPTASPAYQGGETVAPPPPSSTPVPKSHVEPANYYAMPPFNDPRSIARPDTSWESQQQGN